MKMMLAVSIVLATTLFAAACGSTPSAPPDETAGDVAAHLVSGDVAGAETRFREIEDEEGREAAYSTLFRKAKALCAERDYASCASINRFLVGRFPERAGPREALVYALWLDRAISGEPSSGATREEIRTHAASLRSSGETPPAWIDLALTQTEIDAGDVDAARSALARFTSRWDGRPPSLRDYAVELTRWIESHAAGSEALPPGK